MPLDPAEAARHAEDHLSTYPTIYVELTSDEPDDDTLGTPVAYTGYVGPLAMAAAAFTHDGAGKLTANVVADFGDPEAGTPETSAVAVEFYSSSAKTYRIAYEELDAPLDIDETTPHVRFPVGALVISFGSPDISGDGEP